MNLGPYYVLYETLTRPTRVRVEKVSRTKEIRSRSVDIVPMCYQEISDYIHLSVIYWVTYIHTESFLGR